MVRRALSAITALAWGMGLALGVCAASGAEQAAAPPGAGPGSGAASPALKAVRPAGVPAAPGVEEWLAKARDAQRRGLVKQALEFAGRAVEAAPSDPRAWHYRAQLHERSRDLAAAEADMTKLVSLAPTEPVVWLDRGTLRLRLGDFAGSIADYDRYVELRPSKAAELWQRGIALFYAGRWEDGRRQFETHRTVNPADVENSAWHYACVARVEGAASARGRWIPVEGDTRLPMREIQELFLGRMTPEQLLAAVEASLPEARRGSGRFYAHLYLALYHGAAKDREREAQHVTEAVKLADGFGIMGEVARLHADWVAKELARGRGGAR